MAISDNDLPDVTPYLAAHYLAQVEAQKPSASTPDQLERGDLTRLGMEAMVRRETGTARTLHSSGSLRFTGPGVNGHSANLDDVALLSSAWQKAVTATGAALENIKSSRGRVPESVRLRTQLVLAAAPQPGSVIFQIRPKQSPLSESEPGGQIPTSEELANRPLADRASDCLLELLASGTSAEFAATDIFASSLRNLGPRVGGTIMALAQAIDKSDVTLDVSWREPSHPTRRVQINQADAHFISDVVRGRGLDAEAETVIGTLQTISSRQRWVIDTTDGPITFDASHLSTAEHRGWKVADRVEIDMTVQLSERGDGTIQRAYSALQIRRCLEAPTLFDSTSNEVD